MSGLSEPSAQLVNVLAILGEYPVIRYYKSNQKPIGVGVAYNEHITRRLAEMVQEGMDKYCRDNENFPVSCSYLEQLILS